MKERRRFYRVEDRIVLNYRIVEGDTLEESLGRLKAGHREWTGLQQALVNIDKRLDQLMVAIKQPFREIAEAIELLNRKVNLIGRMADLDVDGTERQPFVPTHDVNVSACGMAFRSFSPLLEGTCLELLLFPSHQYVRAYGEVTGCRNDAETDLGSAYKIAVDFKFIRDDDRELLVSHILKKQSELLKAERQSSDPQGGLGAASR